MATKTTTSKTSTGTVVDPFDFGASAAPVEETEVELEGGLKMPLTFRPGNVNDNIISRFRDLQELTKRKGEDMALTAMMSSLAIEIIVATIVTWPVKFQGRPVDPSDRETLKAMPSDRIIPIAMHVMAPGND